MSASARWLAARSFIVRLDVPAYWQQPAYRDCLQRWIREGLGGVCLFGGTVEQAARAAHEIAAMARVPIVVAADLEFGLPMRFSGGTAFPRAWALARAGRPEWTAAVARTIARQARWCGIGWNFAPVCDVAIRPASPIGIRAFGQDAAEAALHVRAWVEASQAEGVWACAKHFPGHGDVAADSHEALPELLISQEQLWERELEPFRAALAAGVAGVMLGHLRVPALGIVEEPASLSAQAVQFLRHRLGYEGIIVTDALDMGAILQHWSTAEAVERALRAGVDLLLMPAELEEAIAATTRLLERSPELLRQRRQSLLRVQRMRAQLDAGEFAAEEDDPSAPSLALRTAWAAIELNGDTGAVPLPTEAHVALFTYLTSRQMELATLFFRLVSQQTRCHCDMAYIDPSLTLDEEQRLLEAVSGATHAVVALFLPPRLSSHELQRGYEFLTACATRLPTVAVVCGNPSVPIPPSVTAVVRTYSDTEPSIAAAAFVLSGVKPPWVTDELV